MNNTKQSSVRWAIEQYSKIHSLRLLGEIGVQTFNRVYNEIIEKGDAMHKEEIIKAWKKGDGEFDKVAEEMSLDYYNETFNNLK